MVMKYAWKVGAKFSRFGKQLYCDAEKSTLTLTRLLLAVVGMATWKELLAPSCQGRHCTLSIERTEEHPAEGTG